MYGQPMSLGSLPGQALPGPFPMMGGEMGGTVQFDVQCILVRLLLYCV